MYSKKYTVIKKVFRKIVLAIKYCHDANISHRDIKFDNILVSEQNEIKIIDFGFAVKRANNTERISNFCGTPNFMAPEIIKRVAYDPSKADVWALGVLLYKLVMDRYPFASNSDQELNLLILKGEFFVSKSVPEEIRRLIGGMLDSNEKTRFALDEVVNSGWLSNK